MEERIRRRIAFIEAERTAYEREAIARMTAYQMALAELSALLEDEHDGLDSEETQPGEPVGSGN